MGASFVRRQLVVIKLVAVFWWQLNLSPSTLARNCPQPLQIQPGLLGAGIVRNASVLYPTLHMLNAPAFAHLIVE
ncbi:hypothetical protein BT67DRAFT_443758 [Trichocladium antarcticum]|uniref:Secreted protein n=1 Tax=Trichocladium antarcticum TaxID=1450529 RepID=A0AAN6UGW9_9PEZI|nr:hypothetical protein BT67DRAFT_443758 [Trichocladium antarcticum]